MERLGRGGMADVYKAYQHGMDRHVAVKIMHGHLAESKDFIERFRREAQSVGQLRHPHILNIIDFDVHDDLYYMVMEYIKGETLKTYLEERKMLSQMETLSFSAQLADALDYAHRNGMIHRDIKPANMMFSDEHHRHIVLTDFGIARILDASSLTMSGAAVGTPAYMSPEAGKGEKVDERSDIYSLGVVMYEMLTGNLPFTADSPYGFISKHISTPVISPRFARSDLNEALDSVVLKTLRKDPAERFQRASELHSVLVEIQAELVSNGATPPPTRIPLPPQEAEAATLIQAPALTPPPSSLDHEKTEIVTPPPTLANAQPDSRPGRPWGPLMAGAALLIAALFGGIMLSNQGDEADEDVQVSSPTAIEISIATEEATEPAAPTPPPTAVEVSIATEEAAAEATTNEATEETTEQISEDSAAEASIEATEETTEETSDGLAPDSAAPPQSADSPPPPTEVANLTETAAEAQACFDEGQALLQAGEYEAAAEAFTCAIDLIPSFAEAYEGRATARGYYENSELPLEDLNQAIELKPDEPRLYVARSGFYRNLERYTEGLEDLQTALALGYDVNNDHYFYIRLADMQKGLADYDGALESLEQALAYEYARADAYRALGDIYSLQVDYEQAIEAYSLALENGYDPGEDPSLYLNRAGAYIIAGDYEAAIADLETATGIDSENGQIYYELAEAYNADGETDLAYDNYGQAIDLGYPEESGNAYPYYNRGLIAYYSYDDYEAALADFTAALELDPGLEWVYSIRGDTHRDLGNYEAAIADYMQALEAYPEDAFLYANLGDIYQRLGDYVISRGFWSQAIELDDSVPSWYTGRGYAELAMGENEAARQSFETALEKGAYDEYLFESLGHTLNNLGEHEAAIANFDLALSIDDSLAWSYQGRAYAYYVLEDYEAAITDFDQVVDLGSGDVYTFLLRGHAHKTLGNSDEAESNYYSAMETNPDLPDPYLALAWFYSEQAEPLEALDFYEQYVEVSQKQDSPLDPRAENFFTTLGNILGEN
jgi:serine/threonine protein kinase/Tfp pilus assembly protein PilF